VHRRVGFLFWLETFFAGLSAFLVVLTAVWHDWVEGIFGFDPDRHDGAFEWQLAAACCVIAVGCSVLARREWRRAALTSAE
jgi:hypothetical protein